MLISQNICEITNEYSTIGDYSLKITSIDKSYAGWRIWTPDSLQGATATINVNTTLPARIIFIIRVDNVETPAYIIVPTGKSTVTLDLNFETLIAPQNIDIRAQGNTIDMTTIYLDNITIYKR